jgi:hypothetical protein
MTSDHVDRKLLRLNSKLQKLIKINPHSKFLVTSKEKKLFTKHGLHYNKQGKYLINLQLASTLLTTFATNSKEPITLDWHDPNEDEQNNMISCEVKLNGHSRRNKKKPVTRTDDFLWTK